MVTFILIIVIIIIISNIWPVLEDLLQIWDLDPGGHCSAQYCEQGAVQGKYIGSILQQRGRGGRNQISGRFFRKCKNVERFTRTAAGVRFLEMHRYHAKLAALQVSRN